MKIKNYNQFITESNSDIKGDIVSFIDSNKFDIESKGLNFREIKQDITDSLDLLDNNFLENINLRLSSINTDNKEEFKKEFEEVVNDMLRELNKKMNENFSDAIISIWNKIKESIKNAIDWILDRIYTISGIATISLSVILLILKQFPIAQSIPSEFANVAINAVFILGLTILKYGQSKDKYKNISEI
jgi:hypothetical protein